MDYRPLSCKLKAMSCFLHRASLGFAGSFPSAYLRLLKGFDYGFPASSPPILMLLPPSPPSFRCPEPSCSVSHYIRTHSHPSLGITKVKKTSKVAHPFSFPSFKLVPKGECTHWESGLKYTGICAPTPPPQDRGTWCHF